MQGPDKQQAQKGRFTAMVIAGTAVFWVLATLIGGQLGLSNRVRALFDMLALAGFIWAFVLIYQIWRDRQSNQG
ncbi:hypothetical protein PEL8287_01661 [Roseovarius litorisediminis]|uniref:DUF5337 domain-containing protein n=1 Tax=Roseovarius litorisediminis TaxID=1312363 RepID=A0A1Y5SB43_9RHOB|nr:DUF5337 domain-containing protein [Roseovarius litorisediminis]SLN34017.1 hypothetical protein PEL8287_01661 [Roseovarius litorisediminis]